MTQKSFPGSREHVANDTREERLLHLCRTLWSKNRQLIREQHQTKYLLGKQKQELHEVKHHLARMYSEIEEEMEMAKSVQEGLMPKALPDVVNIKSAAVYIPTGKVGGDLYDIIITPRQKIAILIFDVSGHGVPAALIGAMAKMLFANFIEKSDSPAAVFYEVNNQLCYFIKTEQYLTAFLGIFDPIKNTMVYSRAGHVPPLIYHARRETISLLDCKGFFIGHSALQDIVSYSEKEVQLDAGDKILFYSDGLTEGCNEAGKLYGNERLKKVFTANGQLDINDLITKIVEDQALFREGCPLRDDFTMLCIEMGSSEHLLNESGFSREEEPNVLLVSSFGEMERVCAVILKDMDRCGFADRVIKLYKICVFEMITNALQHGNKGDTNKKAYIFYKVTPETATISVIDEGEGYDYTNLPNPLLPENRMKDHGRGVFLVRNYMDEVSFNEKGNRILGRKYHQGM